MAIFEYNPFADVLTITYSCPTCGHKNTDSFVVPTPDWTAETHHDSVNSDNVDIQCGHCGTEYCIALATGIYGGEGELQGVEDITHVEQTFPQEDDNLYDYHLH